MSTLNRRAKRGGSAEGVRGNPQGAPDFPLIFLRGHPYCFRKSVGQRRKPLQNDADECDFLHSGKGVVCFPVPTMRFCWRGHPCRVSPNPFRAQAASLRSAGLHCTLKNLPRSSLGKSGDPLIGSPAPEQSTGLIRATLLIFFHF